MIPMLKKCFCMNIEAGGILLGWFGLVMGMINFATGNFFVMGLLDFTPPDNTSVDAGALREMMSSTSSYAVCSGIIEMIANLLLLYGIIQQVKMAMIPWLFTFMVNILLMVVTFFFFGYMLVVNTFHPLSLIIAIFGMPIIAFMLYFWLCIFSLYRTIKIEEHLNVKLINGEVGIYESNPDLTSNKSEA